MKNIRTCIACRQKFDKTKTNLIKITKSTSNKILIDDTPQNGRSCYICKDVECINKVIKNKLINKVFKSNVNNEVYEKLEEFKG